MRVFVATVLCLPAYLRLEPHQELDGVSLACLTVVSALSLWWFAAVLCGLLVTLRTLRFARASHRSGEAFIVDDYFPVLRIPHFGFPVARVGLLRPVVVISDEFAAAANRLNPDCLALAHERAHAAQWDNWKILSLAFLPRFDPFLPRRYRWIDLRQSVADWAADDDAVQGDPSRSLLLAEVLVQAARCVRSPYSPALCATLTSAETGLAARVARLTRPQHNCQPDNTPLLHICAVLVLLAGAGLAFFPWFYPVSEWLLHLGTA